MAVAAVRLGTAAAIYVGMKTTNNNGGETMTATAKNLGITREHAQQETEVRHDA